MDAKPEAPEPTDVLTAARRLFEESKRGGFPPKALPVLLAGGKEILTLPHPWGDTDVAIVRWLDGAYGARTLWSHATRTWAERVEATLFDLEKITELEAIVAQRLDEYGARRSSYTGLHREERRRHLVLDALQRRRTLEVGEFPAPVGEKLTPEDFEALATEIKRAERAYIAADEALAEAKGELIQFKLKLQERYFRSPQAWAPRYAANGERIG